MSKASDFMGANVGDALKKHLEHVAILTRLSMANENITADEAITKTVEIANSEINKIMSMHDAEFFLHCCREIVTMEAIIEEMEDEKSENDN
jgi:hypothetical protein